MSRDLQITVKARDLDKLRAACKKVDRGLGKEFRQVWLKVAKHVLERAEAAAPSHTKGALKARATQKAAFVRITPGPRGDALAEFWGMRRRAGWYSHPRYRNSAGRQKRPWVGNQWDPGAQGGKPYFIGDAINDSVDEVVEILGDGVEDLARKAGFM